MDIVLQIARVLSDWRRGKGYARSRRCARPSIMAMKGKQPSGVGGLGKEGGSGTTGQSGCNNQ